DEQIYRYSRVCAVADCFDAMTADRVYRPGMSSARALELMQTEMASFFEPELVWQFIQCVAPYPVGSVVTVTGGRQAVVVGVRRGKTYRPRIRLVLDADGRPLPDPEELELEEHPHMEIIGVLQEGPTEFVPELVAE
ncbi:MAG TPA: HD-GYP domain-containing protein, partial [Symbiobacteriaceae bacterium]|nr:HD-GYP domain-containing protein [Symbiobacteriaceae bacterium]